MGTAAHTVAAMKGDVAAAYSAAGAAWAAGPARVYRRLADELVARCPGGVQRRRVLDLGAGTGVAGDAARAAGAATVVAVDVAPGMLAAADVDRPVAGDALALPFRDGDFDAVIAAFSLNHVDDPAAGLREAARVVAPGGGLVAGAYAADDTHPAKAAAEAAATARGWAPPPWYEWVRSRAVPALASVDSARTVLDDAGVRGTAEHVRVLVDGLSPGDLVAWRLGMAQLAPFVASLPTSERDDLAADAVARLGADPPPLVRSIIVVTACR